MERQTHSASRRVSLAVFWPGGCVLLAGVAGASVTAVHPWAFVALLAVSAFLTTFVAWRASRRLFSGPTIRLADTIHRISTSHDYSLRAAKESEDEIGALVDKLNELIAEMAALLAEMAERDQHLKGEGDRLEEEVTARTKELLESNQRLEAATEAALEANRAQGQFIANMTHEIRTPMNGVLGMAELLSNTDLTPQQQKFTRTVLESAEDLLAIINNVLDFSKVEAGKLEKVDDQPFSPRECVEKVSELLDSRAKPKGVELTYECADDVPTAMLGDGKRVRQVVTNIIGNAIKFTERGTIVVRTTLVQRAEGKDTIRFEVVDTGVGIASHLHQHVFEGFSQADTSTTRQFGGTGLGLAISKHLVELMGGQIGVISRPGVGSNFWFTVPGEIWHAVTTSDRDLSGVHALIVAKSHGSRDALKHQLTTCGGTCVTAPDIQRALDEIRHQNDVRQPFDVALIDAQGLDCFALAGKIHADEVTKSLPVVLMSNVERGERELREAGIDGFVRLPVEQKQLVACVARVTGRLNVAVGREDREQMELDAWGARSKTLAAHRPQEGVCRAHVLVAEDNLVNREVATTMLDALQCSVDVVDDGLQAVEAVKGKHYDLVFLDCQMPNLDGYQAARQIRELEQQGLVGTASSTWPAEHLPMVALTAHTAPADRTRSLESGMDDYVSKPFTLATLDGMLGKWVPQAESAPTGKTAESAPRETEATDDGPISEAAIEGVLASRETPVP